MEGPQSKKTWCARETGRSLTVERASSISPKVYHSLEYLERMALGCNVCCRFKACLFLWLCLQLRPPPCALLLWWHIPPAHISRFLHTRCAPDKTGPWHTSTHGEGTGPDRQGKQEDPCPLRSPTQAREGRCCWHHALHTHSSSFPSTPK